MNEDTKAILERVRSLLIAARATNSNENLDCILLGLANLVGDQLYGHNLTGPGGSLMTMTYLLHRLANQQEERTKSN